jgi:hypothetical protein
VERYKTTGSALDCAAVGRTQESRSRAGLLPPIVRPTRTMSMRRLGRSLGLRGILVLAVANLIIGKSCGFWLPSSADAGFGQRCSSPARSCPQVAPTCRISNVRLRQSWRTDPPSDNDKFSYSDDCFGLISLSTGIAAKDASFAAVFVALSALTAVASATVLSTALTAKDERKVPGAVAGATLILAPLVKQVLFALGIQAAQAGQLDSTASWAPLLEAGVCTFSLLYGFVLPRTSASDR